MSFKNPNKLKKNKQIVKQGDVQPQKTLIKSYDKNSKISKK